MSKCVKADGSEPTEIEASVATELKNLEQGSSEIKVELRELTFLSAREVDVGGGVVRVGAGEAVRRAHDALVELAHLREGALAQAPTLCARTRALARAPSSAARSRRRRARTPRSASFRTRRAAAAQ